MAGKAGGPDRGEEGATLTGGAGVSDPLQDFVWVGVFAVNQVDG